MPTTPEGAAQALKGPNGVRAVATYLNQLPAESRSAAAVRLVAAASADPASLIKLATGEGWNIIAPAIGTRPYDADAVTKTMLTLNAARPGARAPAPAGAQPPPPASAARPWLPASDVSRDYGPSQQLPANMAQAVRKEGYVDNMQTRGSTAYAQTRGWGNTRTVGIKCSFEVGLINPRTGRHEAVLFRGVEDHRPAGFGWGDYDTSRDLDSRVLVCTGQNYSPPRPNPADPMNYISGSMTSVSAVDYRAIPDLRRRVERWLATGETGNEKPK